LTIADGSTPTAGAASDETPMDRFKSLARRLLKGAARWAGRAAAKTRWPSQEESGGAEAPRG